MARPRGLKDPTAVTFWVENQQVETLRKHCESTGTSLSQFARQAFSNELRKVNQEQ